MTASIILEAKNLTKDFKGRKALDQVTFTLPSGSIVGLLGPNGSGKTTLMKLTGGLITPTSGQILINGKAPGVESKKIVAYLPDANYLNDWMKVRDLLKMFAEFYADFNEHHAMELVYDLGIDENQRLKTLSKGTQEKVQLILAMCRNARLYMLDEPIGGVDPAAREYIINTIIGNYNPDATVLISTHLISDVEKILDYALFLKQGQIAMAGAVDDLRAESGKSLDELFREVFKC